MAKDDKLDAETSEIKGEDQGITTSILWGEEVMREEWDMEEEGSFNCNRGSHFLADGGGFRSARPESLILRTDLKEMDKLRERI